MVFNLDPSLSTILSQKILQRLWREIKKYCFVLKEVTNYCLFLRYAGHKKTPDGYGSLIETISFWALPHAPHILWWQHTETLSLKYPSLYTSLFSQTQDSLSVGQSVGLSVCNTVELHVVFCITVPAISAIQDCGVMYEALLLTLLRFCLMQMCPKSLLLSDLW